MTKDVLYLGDTALDGPASYLAGVMSAYGIGFDYFPSDWKFDSSVLDKGYRAIVLSDYSSSNFSAEQLDKIAAMVKDDGLGLLMIGGWETFTGLEGGYNQTVLKDVLPVVMSDCDDRVNHSGPCLVEKKAEHEIVAGLPFAENAPNVGGFNLFEAKADGEVLLATRRFGAVCCDGEFKFAEQESAPLLVTGSYGAGKVAAFASDVAPHWIGGMVDWGDERLEAQAEGAGEIEVGNWYGKFFSNLVNWVQS